MQPKTRAVGSQSSASATRDSGERRSGGTSGGSNSAAAAPSRNASDYDNDIVQDDDYDDEPAEFGDLDGAVCVVHRPTCEPIGSLRAAARRPIDIDRQLRAAALDISYVFSVNAS